MRQSPTQKLNRDFNWRKGSMRRLAMFAQIMLDGDLGDEVQQLISRQHYRDNARFKEQMAALKANPPSVS